MNATASGQKFGPEALVWSHNLVKCRSRNRFPLLRFDQILTNRKADHVAKALKFHLVHDVIAMALDRPC